MDVIPVTGAWQPGDDVGHRQFFTFATDRRFAVDSGATLTDVTIAYETWGRLAPDASNAVLVCHAWTGDSHAAGLGRPRPRRRRLVGRDDRPGQADRHRSVVRRLPERARRMPGLDRTGVADAAQRVRRPADGTDPQPYGSRFPVITIRDMVRAQARLADHLGIPAWHTVLGGSMGGMQVLEWAIMYPERVRGLVPIATCMQSTAQQIAWGSIGRRAIKLDPRWRGGDYYDAEPGDGPGEGLSVARMVAQVTFRSDNVFTERFGRAIARRGDRGDGAGDVAAVRGRAVPRAPRPQARATASTPTATS